MSPNQMPAAEVDVTAELVRGLLAEQHPDLADLPIRLLANGWDNVIFRLGDNLLARLPRRETAARLITNELRWLPGIAPGLPLPVPAPVRAGVPGRGYPWHWSVTPYLPGEPAAERPPADPESAAITLGRFLGALHPANILVSQGRLSGVIDFGDLTSGDPAADLAIAWMTLPLGVHPAFRTAYLTGRDPDAGLWARARGWALALALVFLAHSADNPQLLGVGRRTIGTILAGQAGTGGPVR